MGENETAMEASTFSTADFGDELAIADSNFDVGTKLLLQNDRVRIWDLAVEPGERTPFHCHRTPYLFVCVEAGRVINRFPSGHAVTMDVKDGDTWFSPGGADVEIHDLENVGKTRVRFTTVELLDG